MQAALALAGTISEAAKARVNKRIGDKCTDRRLAATGDCAGVPPKRSVRYRLPSIASESAANTALNTACCAIAARSPRCTLV